MTNCRPPIIVGADTVTVALETLWDCNEYYLPYSFLFTDLIDNLLCYTYGTNKRFTGDVIEEQPENPRTLLFEDFVLQGHALTTFNNVEYPIYERDAQGNITKGTVIRFVNEYYYCILTVEADVQDVHIAFPPELTQFDN